MFFDWTRLPFLKLRLFDFLDNFFLNAMILVSYFDKNLSSRGINILSPLPP